MYIELHSLITMLQTNDTEGGNFQKLTNEQSFINLSSSQLQK